MSKLKHDCGSTHRNFRVTLIGLALGAVVLAGVAYDPNWEISRSTRVKESFE